MLTTATILANLHAGSPAVESIPITPSDGAIEPPLRSLYCTVGGTVTFKDLKGNTSTWTVPGNFYINVCMSAVTAATATGLHGLR